MYAQFSGIVGWREAVRASRKTTSKINKGRMRIDTYCVDHSDQTGLAIEDSVRGTVDLHW